MRRSLGARALALAGLLVLILPTAAFAQDEPPLKDQVADAVTRVDVTWVIVAALLVMFMQAGFAFLEIGFVRGKNAGSVIAKILTNFSIASIGWWVAGFAIAFGGGAKLAGDTQDEVRAGELREQRHAEQPCHRPGHRAHVRPGRRAR